MRRLQSVFASNSYRYGFSSSNFVIKRCLSSNLSDLKYLPPDELQKELLKIKRKMLSFYNTGDYKNALVSAERLEAVTDDVMGKENAVYASCLSNVALMNTKLGNNDKAMDKYIKALHIYDDVSGKKSASYAATLTNLGVLYKNMAEMSKGEDKLQLLERSEEALTDTAETRTQLFGPNHKETLFCSIHLAGTKRVMGKYTDAERILKKTLDIALKTYGDLDIIVATIYNNLGLTWKCMQVYDKAKECYGKALEIYRDSVGDAHPEAITTRHNLAELHIIMGEDDKAVEIQDYVLELLDVSKEEADMEVEELQKQYEAKTVQQNGVSTAAPATSTSTATCTKEENNTEGKIYNEMEMVQQNLERINDPEYRKKIDYDNIDPLSEEDLGFNKAKSQDTYTPSTAPATRKNRSQVTQEEMNSAKPAVIEEGESPFEAVKEKKKKFNY